MTRIDFRPDGARKNYTSYGGGMRNAPSILFALPALLIFIGFSVIPVIGVVLMSFTSWQGLGAITFTGITSWKTALSDPLTSNAIVITVKIMVLSFSIQAPLSLLLGVFLAGRQKYREVLGILYFVPMLLSSAAIAVLFRAFFDPNFGIGAFSNLPIFKANLLGSKLAIYTVTIVIAWQFIPFHTLIYQGGVRQIPQSIFEAAKIDGANRWQEFWYITLPQLKHTAITSTTLMIVGSLTYFDLVFVMTKGGPGVATRMLPLHMYITGFQANQMGVAAALGVMLLIVGFILALITQRLGGKDRSESQTEGAL